MAVTILEALENAYFNLVTQKIPGLSERIGSEQFKNALTLLHKGYSLDDEVEPLLADYESVDEVPKKYND